jgi:ferritin
MITKKMETALNKQMNYEFYVSTVYLSMSSYFATESLDGFANWMRIQAEEERTHAMKLFDFIIDRDGVAKLATVKAPPLTWKTPLAACQDTLKRERENTQQISDLMELSFDAGDHATRSFLQWFIDEQVEEEAQATKLVEDTKRVGNEKAALFMLDRELGTRTLGPVA